MSDGDGPVEAVNTQQSVDSLRIKLPLYDGIKDPKSWLRQLKKAKTAKNWTDAQLVAQAPLLLTGRADEFWETIESATTTWKEFGERKTVDEHLCE